MQTLNVPIESISELKKSPMKAIEESKKNNTGTYILNNNKPVGVVMEVGLYEELLEREANLQKITEELREKLFDAQIDMIALSRIQDKNPILIPADEVMGAGWDTNLEEISDDWE